MRLTLPLLLSGLVLVPFLTGCGSSPSTASSRPATSSAVPAPTGSASSGAAARPTRVTRAQLTAALPTTAAELHGGRRKIGCTFGKPCDSSGVKDFATVDITFRKQRLDIEPQATAMVIVRTHTQTEQEALASRCPPGRVSIPIKDTGATTFAPGQRGRQSSTPISSHGWKGFLCDEHISYLLKGHKPLPRQHWRQVWLSDGKRSLFVYGGPLALTRTLAEEYLDRLVASS